MHDLVIRGGRIVDGTGNPWFRGDIAVAGDTIVEVGRLREASGRRVVDATGLVVCPGFVDMHAHSDLALLAEPRHEPKVLQGITTELIGQDGLSYAPIGAEALPVMRDMVAGINGAPDVAYDWTTVAQFLDRLEAARPAVNVAYLVPHGALRLSVMGMADRPAGQGDLREMARLAAEGMADGALGLSTGLTYPPAQWSEQGEITEICRAIRPFGGIYVTHHRDYGAGLRRGVTEALEIGRDAGVPVHFSHFHISGAPWRGRANEFLALIDQERAQGREVTLDAYPYLAGSTFLGAWLPESVQGGTPTEVLARLRDPTTRPGVIAELDCGPRSYVIATWDEFVVAGVRSATNRALEGRRIPALAAERNVSVGQFICDLLIEEEMNVTILVFVGNEENVRTVMQHPTYMVGTDGILVGGTPHPRAYGTFPKLLGEYVRELGVLRLEDAVRKMTGAAAQRMGLWDRGLIRPDMKADLVAFDPATIATPATYADPKRPPVGLPYVFVNGVAVKWEDAPTGAQPGRVLRHNSAHEGKTAA